LLPAGQTKGEFDPENFLSLTTFASSACLRAPAASAVFSETTSPEAAAARTSAASASLALAEAAARLAAPVLQRWKKRTVVRARKKGRSLDGGDLEDERRRWDVREESLWKGGEPAVGELAVGREEEECPALIRDEELSELES